MEVISKLLMMIILMIAFITSPMFSKKDIYFGVRLKKNDYEQLKIIKRKYIIKNLVVGVILTLLMIGIDDPIVGILGITFGYIALYTVIYVKAYKEVKILKNQMEPSQGATVRITTIDTNFTKERTKDISVSPWYFLIPISIVIVTSIVVMVNYSLIPDPIPMHYNVSGEVDRWAKKTYLSTFMLQLVSLIMTGIFYFVYLSIGKSKQEISNRKPKTSIIQNRMNRKIWSIYAIAGTTLMNIMFSYLTLNLFRDTQVKATEMMYVILGITFVMIIATFVIGFYLGTAGNKLKVDIEEQENPIEENDDDRYWIWGSIYYNPNDPSVFVEKRVGIGWTVNMASKQGRVYIIGILVVTVAIVVLSMIAG